jgi:hypothetical protein
MKHSYSGSRFSYDWWRWDPDPDQDRDREERNVLGYVTTVAWLTAAAVVAKMEEEHVTDSEEQGRKTSLAEMID